MMRIKVKKLHPDAVIPKYAKDGDAGLDLTAIKFIKLLDMIEYHTGLAFEIPEGYVGLIFPRSSIYKTSLTLSNSVGVIDSGYRGEVKFKYRIPLSTTVNYYTVGERVGQLIVMPYPEIQLEEVEHLSTTERGDGGFGHSGR